MKHLIILLTCYLFVNGCSSQKPVTFANGDDLLRAASQIQLGDTRNDVERYLGWRKDREELEVSWDHEKDSGYFFLPRISFRNWKVYPVSLYVGFTDDAQVNQIRYYDERRRPDGPYLMIGSDFAIYTKDFRIAEL